MHHRMSVKKVIRIIIAFSILPIVCGCSPYLYKDEVGSFNAGVGQLNSAYSDGLEALTNDRAQKSKWSWITVRSALAPTEGCVLDVADAPKSTIPCELHAVNQPVPSPSQTAEQIRQAKAVFDSLENYSAGLSSITNAADRAAFDAAQEKFKVALQNIADLANKNDAAVKQKLGAIANVFADISGIYLDDRRFEALKSGTEAANPAIKVLGMVAGKSLDALRYDRGRQVYDTINLMSANIGPSMDPSSYGTRVDLLQGKVSVLERLRNSDPLRASKEMVEAHEKLVAALGEKDRQAKAIFIEIQKFLNDSSAVRNAFTDKLK